jgi:hypothetical protein
MNHGMLEQYATKVLRAELFAPEPQSPEHLMFSASLQSIAEHMRWTERGIDSAGRGFAVIPGFVERMTPNALADMHEGSHVIIAHQALLVTIFEFALFVFTQRELFPQIGNGAEEESPPAVDGHAPGLMLLQKTLAGEAIVPESDKRRVPKDADRHVAAAYLAQLMMRFVWLHELAHSYLGHVGFVRHAGLALRLYEVPEPLDLVEFTRPLADRARDSDALRALELEADETAFLGCCQIQLAGLENIDGIKALDLDTRLGLTIFGAYAMTWLFSEYQNYMNSRRGYTHPEPYERMKAIYWLAVDQVAPKPAGFDVLHASIMKQFNSLVRAIPAIHRIDDFDRDPAQARSARALRDSLDATLLPFRFTERAAG